MLRKRIAWSDEARRIENARVRRNRRIVKTGIVAMAIAAAGLATVALGIAD